MKILLVDTSSKFIEINAYLATKTKYEQLIFHQIGNLGSLKSIKNFNTKNFFVAVTDNDYNDGSGIQNQKFFHDGLMKTECVALFKENYFPKEPCLIHIFPNNMFFRSPGQACGISKHIADATKEFAELKAQQNKLIVGGGFVDESYVYREFIPQHRVSQQFSMKFVSKECDSRLFNTENVLWYASSCCDRLKYGYTKKDIVEFDLKWVNQMIDKLITMKNTDTSIVPTLEGEWVPAIIYLGNDGHYTITNVDGKFLPIKTFHHLLRKWFEKGGDLPNKHFWEQALPQIINSKPVRAIFNKHLQGTVI